MTQQPPKAGRIDPRTCRPDSAYPKRETQAERYVRQFSRALGHKPTRTLFGDKEVVV